MKNRYVEKNREILRAYNNKVKELKAQKEFNKKTYANDIVIRENKKIEAEEASEFQKAMAEINKNFLTVKSCLTKASALDPSKVHTEIKELFGNNSVYNLSKAEVQAIIDKYNPTNSYEGTFNDMRYIGDWLAVHDTKAEGEIFSKYEGIKVPSALDAVNTYKDFSQTAIDMINKIYNNGAFSRVDEATGKALEPIEIESYGDPNFGASLYAIIGDGSRLEAFESIDNTVPEGLSHTFDDIKLGYAGNSMYFEL